MGIRLHERYHITHKAQLEFQEAFAELERKYELTYGEMFSILGDAVVNMAKYAIRAERHPDSDKRGDEG